MVFIKCFPIWLQIGIPKQLGKIHVSSKFQPFSSKNERVAIFFGIYEVSGLKISKYREIPKLWISLFFLENCQILPNFSQSIPNLTNFYFFWKYNLLDTHFSCKFSSLDGEEMKEEKEFIKYYKAEFRANEEWSNLPRASLWYQVSNFML